MAHAPVFLPAFSVAIGYEHDGTPHMALEGELDIASLGRLRRVFEAVLGDSCRMVLDLGRLRFLDLPAVRLLREFDGEAADRACRLEVSGATGQVARLLELIGLRGQPALTA